MMSATYATFVGRVVKESRGGTVRRYVADTLGSTAKLTDPSGSVTDTITYWPYGEERSRTGTTATPFRFVGTLGYYRDAATRLYVRARSYLAGTARWMTVDPLWPMESAYRYLSNDPVEKSDPSGLQLFKPYPPMSGSNCDPDELEQCVAKCERAGLMLLFYGNCVMTWGFWTWQHTCDCTCQHWKFPLRPRWPRLPGRERGSVC